MFGSYRVKSFKVVSACAVGVNLNLGFGQRGAFRCMIQGVDAPPHDTTAGRAVASAVEKWLDEHENLICEPLGEPKVQTAVPGRLYGASNRELDLAKWLIDGPMGRHDRGEKEWSKRSLSAALKFATEYLGAA